MRLFSGRRAARFSTLVLLFLGFLLGTSSAFAQDADDLLPVTEAFKLTAEAAVPGEISVHFAVAPNYYLYRGRMKFIAGEGMAFGEAALPPGRQFHDEFLGDVETYHADVQATVPYTLSPGTTPLRFSVQFQGCHEVDPKICYPPYTQQFELPVPAGAGMDAASEAGTAADADPLGGALLQLGSRPSLLDGATDSAPLPAEQAFQLEGVANAQGLVLRWTMPKNYYLYRDQTTLAVNDAPGLSLTPQWPEGIAHHDEYFGDVTVYFDQVELPVTITGDLAGRQRLTVAATFQGCLDGGMCYPPMTRLLDINLASTVATTATVADVAPQMPPTGAGSAPLQTSLFVALLLALGGGLILNLMPCVLPVLSIKAVSVLESGENRVAARRHAFFYSAGVIISFCVLGLGILALRSAGDALGWGVQMQQPVLVGVLACVMLAVGLSMSGVVQFGTSLGNTGAGLASRSGPMGDFFTGVLAVVVAGPCTAPFMGSALAYAFAAPRFSAFLVFLALGVGLALPFIAIGLVPALARLLPRPGRWMETLKQVLAFPMYLAAVWLVWVLANQRGADAVGLVLVAMVLLAMTLWSFERSRSRGTGSRVLVAVLALATVVPLYLVSQVKRPTATATAEDGVVAYSAAKLAELRKAGTPVFVDMTADWCVTCKANEHAVLNTPAFRDLLNETRAVYMKGDWTDVDPAISAFLTEYHSPGVPLYVVFPSDGGPGKKLPTVLTFNMVKTALLEAAKP